MIAGDRLLANFGSIREEFQSRQSADHNWRLASRSPLGSQPFNLHRNLQFMVLSAKDNAF